MYKTTSSLLRATRSKLSSSSSRTFAYPHTRTSPSLTAASSQRTFSSAAAAAAAATASTGALRSASALRPEPSLPSSNASTATPPPWASENPFKGNLTSLPKPSRGEFGKFYSRPSLNDPRVDRLPYPIRILLESAIHNCDNFQVTKEDVEKIIDRENSASKQDFTGVPAVVDLACMRDAMNKLGSDSNKINPLNYNALGLDILSLARTGNGLGSSRVWAANGPVLLGVRGAYADKLGLTGHKHAMSTVTSTTNETKSYSLRPLSPHLPIYQPQLSSTLSIFNRISGAILATVILLFYMIYI